MTIVDKYIKLYKESKVTPLDVKHQLKARQYKEWWDKLYTEYEN